LYQSAKHPRHCSTLRLGEYNAALAMTLSTGSATRDALLRRALALEVLTVGWNVVEGVVAVCCDRLFKRRAARG
jgi:hypothetical protein